MLGEIPKVDVLQILSDIWANTLVQDFILEELNQDDQLRKGEKSDGSPVGFYKSDAYASLKKQLGGQAPLGTVDLFADGDFYSTFRIEVLDDGFRIEADTNIYDLDFSEVYGKEILGLSDQSIEKLREFVFPMFVEKLYEQLFFI